MPDERVPYICIPSQEEMEQDQWEKAQKLSLAIVTRLNNVLETRCFLPHLHIDNGRQGKLFPKQKDYIERSQILKKTSLLIALPLAPSWSMGLKLEMAHEFHVSAVILCDAKQLHLKKVSDELLGNPAVIEVIDYYEEREGVTRIAEWVYNFSSVKVLRT